MEALRQMWLDKFEGRMTDDWWTKKSGLYRIRGYEVLQIKGRGALYRRLALPRAAPRYDYNLHLALMLQKSGHFYIEELVAPFTFETQHAEIFNHRAVREGASEAYMAPMSIEKEARADRDRERFSYDRQAAVKYAERWWNSYNPDYQRFEVDCTNYVSQCLFAGGAPMQGASDRNVGWWYKNDDWSFSWSVAHSLRWYLSGSTSGLKGVEIDRPTDLKPGDVICYDFEGDGRWDHNTIVVAKDVDSMPLVNAHTDNSRMRYWSYEDSLAWTPETAYKFFRIG